MRSFMAALAADMDDVCTQCPHTKTQHYNCGPRCFVEKCPCEAFLVTDPPTQEGPARTLSPARTDARPSTIQQSRH